MKKVRMKGLEPPRPKALDPKSSAATNYATSAISNLFFGKFKPAKLTIFRLNTFRNHEKYLLKLQSIFNCYFNDSIANMR